MTSRNYAEQDFEDRLNKFLNERDNSLQWLRSLNNSDWNRIIQHSELGEMSAKLFLSNWRAHDYLHIRQVTALKYAYLKHLTNEI